MRLANLSVFSAGQAPQSESIAPTWIVRNRWPQSCAPLISPLKITRSVVVPTCRDRASRGGEPKKARPITLLEVAMQIWERVLLGRLEGALGSIVQRRQFGFSKRVNAESTLETLWEHLADTQRNGENSPVVGMTSSSRRQENFPP